MRCSPNSTGRFAEALPGLAQVHRQISGQRGLRRRPAVVRLAFGDPLLAVIALVSGSHPPRATSRRFARADRRQHVADWRTNHRVGDVVERSRLGIHDDDTRAGRLGERNEASHRIHLEAGPYREQEVGVPRGARGGVNHLRDESLAE